MKLLTALFAAWYCGLPALLAAPERIVICTYNVRNYVDAKAAGEGQRYAQRAKSEPEIAALVRIIKEINPDVLGVCEMGARERFDEFKRRLADAGLGYVDSEYVEAVDTERRLALLSRFPIASRQPQTDVSFEINGKLEKVRRGFLDVTIQVTPDYQLRMVGVHLKSKLPVPEGDALIRRYEAQALRRHLEKIMAENPAVNLACYGDFNDTKNEPVFQEISGVRGAANYMADLWARDPLGDRWTHYWKAADQYSRIDYIFVSPGLAREVVKETAAVYRGPDWEQASDHRPVYATIVPVNRP